MSVLTKLIEPHAVTMLFIVCMALLGYGFPGYRDRATGGFYWLLWLIVGILALVSWIFLVFA